MAQNVHLSGLSRLSLMEGETSPQETGLLRKNHLAIIDLRTVLLDLVMMDRELTY